MHDDDLLFVAYVDGELESEAIRKAEAMIAADPRARETVEMFRDTAAILRTACSEEFYLRSGEDLNTHASGLARIFGGVGAKHPARRSGRARAFLHYGAAVAASVTIAIVAFGGGAIWARGPSTVQSDLLRQVASYHQIYSHETRHLVEVPVDQTEHLKQWLGKRLDRELVVPDLADFGLHFAGARMVVINDHPVGQLMYTRDQGLPIGICVTELRGAPASLSIESRGPLRLAMWEDGSYAYVVVGELGASAARDIAGRVEAELGYALN
jgi:anti-sigma factor RsiW